MGNNEKMNDSSIESEVPKDELVKQMCKTIDSAFTELGTKNDIVHLNSTQDIFDENLYAEKMLEELQKDIEILLQAMKGHDLIKNPKLITKGLLRGFVIKIGVGFISEVDYHELEDNIEDNKEKINISNVTVAIGEKIENFIINGKFNHARKLLPLLSRKVSFALRKYPNIFLGYSFAMAQYHLFSGCLEFLNNNLQAARKIFLLGLIYECIWNSRSIDVLNLDERLLWAQDNFGNLRNFNNICEEKRIENPYAQIKYHRLARLYVSYLLSIAQGNLISQKAVWALGQHIIRMLDISKMKGEIESFFLEEKAILGKIPPKLAPMEKVDWDFILPTLQHLQAEIEGFNTVDELGEHLCQSIQE